MKERYEIWTDGEVSLLMKMATKFSASEISEKLPGKSRNAVIGKLHRMGVNLEPKKPRNYKPLKNLSKPARQALDLPVVHSDEGKHILELEIKHCKWPLWKHTERPNMRFCGEDCVFGQSYCQEHRAKAHAPSVKPNRKRVAEESRIH